MTDPTRIRRFDDKKEMSSRIGETSRFVAFGLIALVFAVHDSDSAFAAAIVDNYRAALNWAGFFGCVAIVSDYLQYFCGYKSVQHALGNEEHGYLYDSSHWAYRGREAFFWMKQVSAFLGAVLILGIVFIQISFVDPVQDAEPADRAVDSTAAPNGHPGSD